MFKQRKHYNKTPSRRKVPGTGAQTIRVRRTPIEIVSLTHNAIVTTHTAVVFDQPVIYTGILPGWTKGGTTVIGVIQIDAVTFTLTWSALIVATDVIDIPFEDPAFRNNAGGYVHTSSVEAA